MWAQLLSLAYCSGENSDEQKRHYIVSVEVNAHNVQIRSLLFSTSKYVGRKLEDSKWSQKVNSYASNRQVYLPPTADNLIAR